MSKILNKVQSTLSKDSTITSTESIASSSIASSSCSTTEEDEKNPGKLTWKEKRAIKKAKEQAKKEEETRRILQARENYLKKREMEGKPPIKSNSTGYDSSTYYVGLAGAPASFSGC
ncbi:hypothetical protein B5S31_g3477 [[Candida] boidinii]|uniref:Unnamed protein product n=1 Tax=Candida boidinii TaxID=5477 RepID=A0ACB5TQ62_CANBO|nr:hypothetical protein B5S29_g4575 [[Candida] boidinii]OWB73718.1 hypothetical protein B5S31_g3477 [[Candida] boidinii]OWB80660.1 hypothetical protein B5S32_g4951 [[Candida] boidinii]GME93030.1 unnamed protein product [[Candida] boidinii]